MKVQCDKCEATYNVPDEKIPEAEVKIRCLKCRNIIMFDGRTNKTDDLTAKSSADPENEFMHKTKETASAISEKAVDFGKKAKEKAANFKEIANEKATSYLNSNEPAAALSEKAASFGKIAREKANDFKELASEKSSEYLNNSDKSITRLNRFLFFSFKIGKYISAFCIVLFFLLFMGSAVFYLTSFGTSFEKPEFKSSQYQKTKYEQKKNYDFSKVNERRSIQNKFDKKIRKVVNLGFVEDSYESFIDVLSDYPEEYREAYIDGIYDYIKNGKEFRDKTKSDYELRDFLLAYDSQFKAELQRVKSENFEAKTKNWIILGVIAASMLLYMLFLLIPILIKIEENTRRKLSDSGPDDKLTHAEFQPNTETIRRNPSYPDNGQAQSAI